MVRQWMGPEASVLGKDLLDDTSTRFEEHKDEKPGETLRIRDMAILTERMQETSEIQGCLNVRKSLLVSIAQ